MSDSKKIYSLGDSVTIVRLNRRGVISDGPNTRGEYLVTVSALAIWVTPENLRPAEGKGVRKKDEKVLVRKKKFALAEQDYQLHSIDLHGLTRHEALRRLEDAIDKTLRGEGGCLEVIHGLGRGTLKVAVHQYLEKCKAVKNFRVDSANPGVTKVYF